ncbi:MAG: UDP-N-acetylmuramoyl-L-alanyl-D-glutamate--2,6-diaminopimelate ligase [Flavobacteriales bacterium]
MKQLKDILYGARISEVEGETATEVNKICFDSRKVEQNDLFVAMKGLNVDGHKFIEEAINNGASTIVCEKMPESLNRNINYIKVQNTREALAYIASNYYDSPSEKLKIIGITGTNGKTTTTYLMWKTLNSLGYKAGLISTVENKVGQKSIPAEFTTPDALSINKLLYDMVLEGCEYCCMEVSSHAIVQHRITGLKFKGGIFTNITHEHLDYHNSFQEYFEVKKSFLDGLHKSAIALSNLDDHYGEEIIKDSPAVKRTYALKNPADFEAKIIESSLNGLDLKVEGKDIWTPLIGRFNAYNVLAVYAMTVLLEISEMEVLKEISKMEPVEGRFDRVNNTREINAIVDFAHSPDALENVLKTVDEIRTGNEQLITVIGCGGDRDKEKRPIMAKIACEYSEQVILTSDNPRSEDPERIINDMKKGLNPAFLKKTIEIMNRKEAIKTACKMAAKNDVVLVAGKGHEKYQEVNGEKKHFDDKEIIEETFKLPE